MKHKKLGCDVRSISNLLYRNVENEKPIEYKDCISGANSYILGYIIRNAENDIYQKNIEERFLITKSTTSKILTLMEKHELIQRISVDGDARLKKIVATPKGCLVHELVKNTIDNVEHKALDGFSEEEVDMLYSYFERIKENLKK